MTTVKFMFESVLHCAPLKNILSLDSSPLGACYYSTNFSIQCKCSCLSRSFPDIHIWYLWRRLFLSIFSLKYKRFGTTYIKQWSYLHLFIVLYVGKGKAIPVTGHGGA
jgi:hypothetical protein